MKQYWKCNVDIPLLSMSEHCPYPLIKTGELAWEKDKIYEEYLGDDPEILARKKEGILIFVEPGGMFSTAYKYQFDKVENPYSYKEIHGEFKELILEQKMKQQIYKIKKLKAVDNPKHGSFGYGDYEDFYLGYFTFPPEIGKRFNLAPLSNYGDPQTGGISTSPVTEIIDESTFHTLNSVYRIELVE